MRALLLLIAASGAAFASGTEPRLRAAEYPAHIELPGGGSLGLQYHGRGIPTAKGGVFLGAHIVLEVAYYPPAGEKAELRGGHFLLRIDRMKLGIPPETPGMVAASLKYSDWEGPRGLQVEAGPVILRPGGGSRRLPGGPQNPDPARRTGARDDGRADPQDLEAGAVQEFAFPEGETRQAVAGYLYYKWGGNLKKMKKLALDYSGPGGPAKMDIPLN